MFKFGVKSSILTPFLLANFMWAGRGHADKTTLMKIHHQKIRVLDYKKPLPLRKRHRKFKTEPHQIEPGCLAVGGGLLLLVGSAFWLQYLDRSEFTALATN